MHLDLQGLLDQPSALLLVPVILVALLVMRGVPALLQLRAVGRRSTAAIALLQATSLPFIVAASQIGIELGRISAVTGAAMVTAGLLSVLIFPVVALGLLRSSTRVPEVPAQGRRGTTPSPPDVMPGRSGRSPVRGDADLVTQ